MIDPTPIVQLLETASPGWWLTVIGSSVLLIWAMNLDSWKGTVAVVVIASAGLIFFGNTKAYFAVLFNLPLMGFATGVYLVVGAIWSVIRWIVFVYDSLSAYAEEKLEWLNRKGLTGVDEIPEGLKAEWTEYLRAGSQWVRKVWDTDKGTYRLDISVIPKLWDHASRATLWGSFWPWSLLQTAGRFLLRLLWRYVIRKIYEWIDSMVGRLFREPNDLA